MPIGGGAHLAFPLTATALLATLIGATVTFPVVPSATNVLAVRASGASTTAVVDEYQATTANQAGPLQSVPVPGCVISNALNSVYGSNALNGQFAFFPCGTSASVTHMLVRIDSGGVVDTTTSYNTAGSSYLPRGAASPDGIAVWATDGYGVYAGSYGSTSFTLLSAQDWYFGSTVASFGGVATLLTAGCTGSGVPCTGSLTYNNPTLPTSNSGSLNLNMAGVALTDAGTMVVVPGGSAMYFGGDALTAAGGLYKWTSATSTASGSWAPYTWGTGGIVKNPVGLAGVHGLTGRFESGGYTLYMSTSATAGNSLLRYDTGADAAVAPGSGYTVLAVAPPGNQFMAVLYVPASPTPSPTATTTPTSSPSNAPRAAVSGYSLAGSSAGAAATLTYNGVSVMDTAGGGTVTFTGTAFGPATTPGVASPYTAAYSNVGLGLSYIAPV